jgi:hypothetical protein
MRTVHPQPRKNKGFGPGLAAAVLAVLFFGCSGRSTAQATPPCDQECQDKVALLAIRETMKLAFNLTLQGKPVGVHDERTACPQGGTVRVFGRASSNAIQGATEVDLAYEFAQCGYLQKDTEPNENYDVVLNGNVVQKGTLAVQPTSTTALTMSSESLTVEGKVYDPPLPYAEKACVLTLGQDGNKLAGKVCGRSVGVDL